MMDFDLLAKDYDIDRRIKRSNAFSDEIRLHITDGHKKSALEYGCGTGLVGLNLVHDFESIVFVDSSTNMIDQVKQKLLDLGKTSSYAICCDFMADVPKDLKVDYIFASLVLHHIKDVKTMLSRFYSVLCNEGHLLIVDKNTGDGSFQANHSDFDEHNGFDQSFLTDLTKEVGFKNAKAQTFYHSMENSSGIFILDAIK